MALVRLQHREQRVLLLRERRPGARQSFGSAHAQPKWVPMTRYASSMSQISRPFLPAAPPPTSPAPRHLALRQKLRLASDKCWHPRVDQDALGRALVLAARDGDAESSSRLLRANPALDAHEHEGETALVAASVGGHVRAVIALLDAGARPDRATRTGNTALRAAVVLGDGECVAALLRGGATVDLETARGTPSSPPARGATLKPRASWSRGVPTSTSRLERRRPPLLAAVREDHLETIEALLTAGADPARVNADGVSPIDLAESLGRGARTPRSFNEQSGKPQMLPWRRAPAGSRRRRRRETRGTRGRCAT